MTTRIPGWVFTIILALIGTLWAGMEYDVRDLLSWKDSAIEKMGNMDAKLDLLLEANGIHYDKNATH